MALSTSLLLAVSLAASCVAARGEPMQEGAPLFPQTTGDSSCRRCQVQGYSWTCPAKNHTCWHSKPTCTLGCSPHACQSTASCAPVDQCSDVQRARCGAANSCCLNSNTLQPFCTRGKATCCDYRGMYCPAGYACDPPTWQCVAPTPPEKPTKLCQVCQDVVRYVRGEGCSKACAFLPGHYALGCELIMKAGACQFIERHVVGNETTRRVCDKLGACSVGSCPCGYCTPPLYGQWCLALPNRCPPHQKTEADAYTPPARIHVVRDGPFAGMRFPSTEPLNASHRNVKQYCASGMCAAINVGCCLTCAP